jgi:radical SAM/Cys-rich protein
MPSSMKSLALATLLGSATFHETVAFSSPAAVLHQQQRISRKNKFSSLCSSTREDTAKMNDGKASVEDDDPSSVQEKWSRDDLFGTSIVDQTLQELENDEEFQSTKSRYEKLGAKGMTKEERIKRRRALDNLGITTFSKFVEDQTKLTIDKAIVRREPEVLQLNIGLYCNQACAHCHVESSPLRKEMMDADVASRCIELLKNTPSIKTLDITGGAPELNEHFRYIVSMARDLRPDDLDIIDRCNLTVLQEPGQEDLIEFLAKHNVHVIASLPCYSADNVNKQRGSGVFERSIAALIALNKAGYGEGSELKLDLVYNPLGAFLPPPQESLQEAYKKELMQNFGICFDSLFTMTNMPIKRFADFLSQKKELETYLDLLVTNFNEDTLPNLMCTNTISIGYDGKVRNISIDTSSPSPFFFISEPK